MLLIVDDDPAQRRATGAMLKAANRLWLEAESGTEALELLNGPVGTDIRLVLLDLVMPDMDGLQVLRSIKPDHPNTPVIVLTGNGSVANAVAAMQAGATDFLIKPISPNKLEIAIRDAIKMDDLTREVERLSNTAKTDEFGKLVAESKATQRAIRIAKSGAQSSIPILIEGESGVGKEVFARAIHASSGRSRKPFVAVNCGALPENLVESILFGHEKGAFTGASARRVGKFEEANGGVLFLDEIGELPLDAQVKLLRAIQEGEVDPVGGSRTVRTDIRLISATNRNLIAEVAAGRFREDLYYRVSVFPLDLPPLRERTADIPALSNLFIRRFAKQENKEAPRLSSEAMALLQSAPWPGNIRQFENMIYRAVVLSENAELTVDDFANVNMTFAAQRTAMSDEGIATPVAEPPPSPLFDENGHIKLMADIEKLVMETALERYDGSMSEAARRLGIGRSTLYRKLRGDEENMNDVA